MKAVDTNVLVRLVIDDDDAQYAMAQAAVEAGIFVPLTVLLELGWVLQSRYRMKRASMASELRKLLDNPFINFADAQSVEVALGLFAQGADFADVIHLIAARGSEAFVTFDRNVPDGVPVGIPIEHIG